MNNKKVKKLVGCVCALTLLIGAIPMNFIKANAEDSAVETTGGVEFYNAAGTKMEDAQFSLHGVSYDTEEGIFVRMDSETAANIAGTNSLYDAETGKWENTVYSLSREAAGGRIRFNTNSTTIKIEAELYQWDASHVSHAATMNGGKYGFDVYVDTADGSTYVDTAVAETKDEDGDEKIDPGSVFVNKTITLGEAASRDITIYFPITIETKNVKITVDENSEVNNHVKGYDGNGRLVFYGSSITQGGCATKPGNTYVNTVGRNLNMEYIDFGMWGRCKGEPAFAEYIASLGNISAFIYDFDHNISKVSLMEPVHYPFYEIIREAYPDIPIIMMTRPGNGLDTTRVEEPEKGYSTVAELKEVIYSSYQRAKANGDENVHFVDGEVFFGYSEEYMRDNSHPNDAGQARMAEVVTDVLSRTLDGEKNICMAPSCEGAEPAYSYDFENDVKAEDGEDNSSATDWTVTLQANKYTEPKFDVINEDRNNVFQLQYTRTGSSVISGAINDEISLSGPSDFTIEMKATAYKNNKWHYIALGIIDDSKDTYRMDVRVIPNGTGCEVACFDRTDGLGTNQDVWAVGYDDTFTFDDLSNQYNEAGTTFTYNLKVDVETVDISGNTGKDLLLRVYVGYQESEDQEPVYQEPVVFKTTSKNASFSPEKLGLFLFATGNGNTAKVTVDDINVYKPVAHTLNAVAGVPATTEAAGKEAHHVCSSCGQLFLDENGILKTTDAELVHTKLEPCSTLYTNDCKQTTHYQLKNGATVDNTGESLLIYGAESTAPSNIILGDPNDNSAKIMTDAQSNFGFKMESTSYKDSNGNWTYAQVGFRKANVGIYGVRIVPTSTGYTAELCKDIDTVLDSVNVVNEKFASLYAAGTEITYKLCVVSDFDTTYKKGDFHVYVDNNYTGSFSVERSDAWKPDTARIYLHSTGTDVIGHQIAIDNIEVYKTTHTATSVAEIPATETTEGTKAHYECSKCSKKFSDEACAIVTSEADLVIPKMVFCTDLFEAFEMEPASKDYWTPKNCTIDDSTGAIVITPTDGATKSYMSATKAYLDKNKHFSFKMNTTLYKDDSGNWSYIGVFFRYPDVGHELQLVPNESGYELRLYDRTSSSTLHSQTVEDERFAGLYAEGTEIMYDLHVRMDANEDNTSVKFYIWVDDNDVVTFEYESDAHVTAPTATRIFLYSTAGGVGHKAALKNMEAYKTTHDSITAVEATQSTTDVAGVKAHYECSDCGKKFLDEAATKGVTDAQLKYAALGDIKCQTRVNENGLTDIRFVAYVDDYKLYQSVTFKLTITSSGKSGTAECKDVYTAVYAGGEKYKTDDIYSLEGYFASFKLRNNTAADLAEEMKVLVTWTDLDGNTRTSERTITISEAQ